MSRKIRLTTNFLCRDSNFGDFQLPEDVTTIGELLCTLEERTGFRFTDSEGRNVKFTIEVLLNGKDIAFYPAGLETSLQDIDSVDISLTPLGGG